MLVLPAKQGMGEEGMPRVTKGGMERRAFGNFVCSADLFEHGLGGRLVLVAGDLVGVVPVTRGIKGSEVGA